MGAKKRLARENNSTTNIINSKNVSGRSYKKKNFRGKNLQNYTKSTVGGYTLSARRAAG